MRVQQTSDVQQAQQLREFCEYLLRIGDGREQLPGVSATNNESFLVGLPRECCQRMGNMQDVVNAAFPELATRFMNADYVLSSAILAAYNEDVGLLNEKAGEMFPGNARVYLSEDSIVDSEELEAVHPPEYLHTINLPNFPPHRLSLKRHQPIMLLRNINPSKGLCNGTRLICRNLLPHVIEATIAHGHYAGEIVYVPWIRLYFRDSAIPFKLPRHQSPVVPVFAMTINKSQVKHCSAPRYSSFTLCFRMVSCMLSYHEFADHRIC